MNLCSLKRALLAITIVLFFNACAINEIDSANFIAKDAKASLFVNKNDEVFDKNMLDWLKNDFLKRHFSVWDDDFSPPKPSEVFWGLNIKGGFNNAKREISDDFYNKMNINMQVEKYPSMKQKAIMLKTASVRVIPTNIPRFSNIDGYPFDRWQNSSIWAFSPVLIVHSDISKEWFLIVSSFVSGWVKSDEVAFINKNLEQKIKNHKTFLTPKNDNIALYKHDLFIESARIGMLLESSQNSIYIYTRDLKNPAFAKREQIRIDSNNFEIFPQIPSQANIAFFLDSIGVQDYGWGGAYGLRDCSSFLKDIFMPFGIWLPRNSLAQKNFKNNFNSILNLPESSEEKLDFIAKNAIPFRTLIWLKGHIMLYLGLIDNEPIVMHSVWGLGNRYGIEILSQISITTLRNIPKKIDIKKPTKSLLERIKTLNILF